MLWELAGLSVMQGQKAFSRNWGLWWDHMAYVKIWLTCDVEVAEMRSRRLCRIGSKAAKEAVNEPLVC